MPTCPTCHEHYTPGDGLTMNPNAYPHVCPPRWLVWNTDQGGTEEFASHVYARSAEGAAELWAEQDDSTSADYLIVKGLVVIVNVKKDPDGPIERFTVTGETVPHYYAEPVK